MSIPADAMLEYFDVLLGAVAVRLGLAAEHARTEKVATTPEAALQRLRHTVLECVEALEQLQATQQRAHAVGDGSDAQAATP